METIGANFKIIEGNKQDFEKACSEISKQGYAPNGYMTVIVKNEQNYFFQQWYKVNKL